MAATTIDRPDDLRKTTRGQLQSPLPQEGRSKEKRSKETIIETKIIQARHIYEIQLAGRLRWFLSE